MTGLFDFKLQKKLKFNDIYQREALYRSALALYTKSLFSRQKARTASWDGKTLYDFACSGPEELDLLHKKLINRKFAFSPARPLQIQRNDKVRTVYIWPWDERVVDLMLYQQINQRLDSTFSASVYAFRWHGYGVDQCQNKTARFIRKHKNEKIYVIKRDVANCFPSIPHPLLEQLISAVTEEKDYLGELLLDHISFSYFQEDGEVVTAGEGVPFGAPTACLLANLALTPFDNALDHLPGSCYTRYADDMLFLTVDEKSAQLAAERFDAVFTGLGLAVKESAALNGLLTGDPGAFSDPAWPLLPGFKHLGLYFNPGGTISLAVEKQRKICTLFRRAFVRCRRRMKKIPEAEKRAAMLCRAAKNMLENTQSQVGVIDYYLKHTNDLQQLRLLDRWLAEEVLAEALKSGHKKGNFAKITFKELRAMGLPSLLHRRSLLLHGHIDDSFLRWKNSQQR